MHILEPSGLQVQLEDAVRAGYAELLSRYVWDVFGTYTYRPQYKAPERFAGQQGGRSGRGPESALRSFRRWLALVLLGAARAQGVASVKDGRVVGSYENGRRRKDPRWLPVYAVGLEKHRSGWLHMHSLIRWPSALPGVRRDAAWKVWFDLYGGARIVPPESMTCLGYIAKYVVKGGHLEISDSFAAVELLGAARALDPSAYGCRGVQQSVC